MVKVSVIIPVYNAAKYLKLSLDSVLGQTVRDIEVICIDDGSTDSSAAVLREYEAKDSRLKILTQANAGQGAARNRGLELASGEFVYFMDADDKLASEDAFELLIGAMEHDSLDLLFFDAAIKVDEGVTLPEERSRKNEYERFHSYNGVYLGVDLWRKMLEHREYSVSPCLMLLRRDFVERYSLRFPEARLFYEDNIFATRVMLSVKRASHRNWKLYDRYYHAGSTITSKPTLRHLRGYLACYLDMRSTLKRGGWGLVTRFLFHERMAAYRYLALAISRDNPKLTEALNPEEVAILRTNRIIAPFVDLFWCWRFRGLAYTLRRIIEKLHILGNVEHD